MGLGVAAGIDEPPVIGPEVDGLSKALVTVLGAGFGV